MLTLLITVLITAALAGAMINSHFSTGATIFWSIFAFIGAFFLVGFPVRRKLSKLQGELQESMQSAQGRMQRKVKQFQNKPGGNVQQMQRQLEADQQAMLKQGLEFTKLLEPFRKWSLLTGRQIATMRFQFHYQLKEFDQADEILATCGFMRGPLMMDVMTAAMRMARCYKKDDLAGAEKVFNSRIRWAWGDRGTILYALMSWIYVQEGQPDEARRVLVKAKEKTGADIFTKNWEHLSNDRVKSFSNAGLGDQWYGLYLETPPAPKHQKQQRMRGNGRNPYGF
ncbi:hypothetical protein [Coraliomargarita akajimensis]|uniref:Uncharacterized protein n=1 Tax=Coraliomargarita akajimensis (strain DSM 45221 / IAM 15411 / JCM 23193 / KCTC 12865 / 04OKA010-24) TaxID=583355 RepID=D5EL44_CORAD|nr:hypothetical protein [Coraliomargarita akajimensis]ADE53146.1 hypothetical protein Caka_0117 [Coraliomargarita akajimensis DSM 45221]